VKLAELAELYPIAGSQRLGYLLDLIGEAGLAEGLAEYVASRNPLPTPLTASQPFSWWNCVVQASSSSSEIF